MDQTQSGATLDLRNVCSIERSSDQGITIKFMSARACSEFEAVIGAAWVDSLAAPVDAAMGKRTPDAASYCLSCRGEGVIHTGIDEAPTSDCKACDGTGDENQAAAPAAPLPELTGPSERRLTGDEKLQRNIMLGMADCMDMVRTDLIEMGIIDKTVAPMFIPEAVAGYCKRLTASPSPAPALPAARDKGAEVDRLDEVAALYARLLAEKQSRAVPSPGSITSKESAETAAPGASTEGKQ